MSSNIMDLKKEIIRLRVALADTEALELGTAERLEKVTAQLESERVSHAAWEKQSLLEYSELMQERDALLVAAERVLRTKRGEDDWLILAIDCVNLEEVIAKLKEE